MPEPEQQEPLVPHRWVYGSAVPEGPDDAAEVLTAAQVEEYSSTGACVVENLWPRELVAAVKADAERIFRSEEGRARARRGLGSDLMSFPCEGSNAFNLLSLHPRLLTAMSQLLHVPKIDLRLTQSELWEKAADRTAANNDQRVHMDFPNHTLVVPPREQLEAVAMLVFWDECEVCGGPTHIVPQQGADDPAYTWPQTKMPGQGGVPWINDRSLAEAHLRENRPQLAAFRERLYERELAVHYGVGTVLLYKENTWHRGTPLLDGQSRLAHNMEYRRSDAEWITQWNSGWCKSMYGKALPQLLGQLSVTQVRIHTFNYTQDRPIDRGGLRRKALPVAQTQESIHRLTALLAAFGIWYGTAALCPWFPSPWPSLLDAGNIGRSAREASVRPGPYPVSSVH